MSTFKKLQLKDLVVNQNYQRPLKVRKVQKMAESWSCDLAGALTVVPVGDKYEIADGQHRFEALKTISNGKPQSIMCHIVKSDGHKMFTDLNEKRDKVSKSDIFRANLGGGEQAEKFIFNTMKRNKILIEWGGANRAGQNSTSQPHLFKNLYDVVGATKFKILMGVIRTRFGKNNLIESAALGAIVMRALTMLFKLHDISAPRLDKALAKTKLKASDLLQDAQNAYPLSRTRQSTYILRRLEKLVDA